MPEILKTVGRYEILRDVGRGGMAVVYLARQTDLDRFVALKELGAFHASDPSFAQRFLRESRVAGSLSHPNIVTVHDYFEHDGTPYIAMEFVERGSLRSYVGRMTLAQVSGVLEGLLAGLAHGEQQGIVHRDLKPENLMVTADGRVKIADFGIAKATTRMQTGAFLTATGTTVGTPTYMAPEQAMAQDIGPWTDLYSVGCMAFELFTGNVPFHDSDAPMAILLRHVNEPIPPVKSIEPSVDQATSDWIERLLVKDPKLRTQSAADAWDDFEEIVIRLLGPRWRREARLLDRVEQVDTPKPLTPAPFEGTSSDAAVSDDFQSVQWGTPGPYTPPPSQALPVEDGETGFVTFGAPAPPPPTDALLPPAEAPPAEKEAPPAEEGFETYVAPPPQRPPVADSPPPEAVAPPPPAAPPPPPPEAAPPPPAPPEPEPEHAPEPAPEPERVPETAMPKAIQESLAKPIARPEAQPRKFVAAAIVAGVVVAAVAGFLIGGSGGDSGGGAPAIVQSSAAMKVKVPEGWKAVDAPPVPGLALTDPKAFAAEDGETVLFGSAGEDADNSTLLPTGVIQAAGSVPERTAVKLGPAGVEAYRYRNVELAGGAEPLTFYAVPTDRGVATVACVPGSAGAPTCEAVANTLELVGREPFPVGPSESYATAVGGVLGTLATAVDKGTAALGKAKVPKAQAAAARDLQAAYRKASRSLPGQDLSPADRGANARLVAALGGVAKAYGQAAAAASRSNKAGYAKAGKAVKNSQQELAGAVEGLRAAGYEIES